MSVVAGTTVAITLTGSAGGDALSGAAISSLPAAGTLNQTNDGTTLGAAIASAPSAVTTSPPAAPMVIYSAGTATGSDSFTYTVADGALVSLPATVTVQIVPVNLAPSFAAGPAISVNEGVLPATYTFPGWASAIANGPGDLSALTGFTVSANPAGLFSTPPTIDLAGTLTIAVNADVYTPGGSPATITVVLNDNGSTAGGGANASPAVTRTVTINQIALQPTLQPQSLTTYPTYPLTVALTGSVPDGAPLTYAITTPPTQGTVSIVAGPPAQAIYTASRHATGADAFVVQATDTVAAGANQGTSLGTAATIALTITPDIPPTATAQDLSVPENQALGIVLAGNDPDHAPAPVLTFALATQPAHGSLSGTPPSLTYTPQSDYVGSDSFTFTAFDGLDTSPPATIGIAVTASGSGSSDGGGGRCGSGNGFAALALLVLTLGGGWRWRRARSGR